MTLQALRETIGDDAFFTLLRRWVSDNEDKTASTEDLVKLAEQISGKDLDQLFNDWLYAKGAPSLGYQRESRRGPPQAAADADYNHPGPVPSQRVHLSSVRTGMPVSARTGETGCAGRGGGE